MSADRPPGAGADRPPAGARISLSTRLADAGQPFDLAADVRAGLTSRPKVLSPKYLYDPRGSRLFERITRLPEYYQTRTEREILRRFAPSLVADLAPRALVEFGSGSADKARILLDEMRARDLLEGYGPVDVSEDAARHAAAELLADYPGLRIEGVIADLEGDLDLPFADLPRLIAFLGSTIGNLVPPEDAAFIGRVAGRMVERDGFLIGFDLVKDPEVLERAYNDAAGVTAEFNLNLLRVLNRELGADFDPAAFRHRAFYDPGRERIEMHLVSLRPQTVRVPDLELEAAFAEGETLRTEVSRKFTRASASGLLTGAGMRVVRWETDPGDLFALALARRA